MHGRAAVSKKGSWSAAALLLAFACLALPVLGGAGVPPGPPTPQAGELQTIRFGLAPRQRGEEADDLRRRYQPLLDYLAKRLGARVEGLPARSYAEEIDDLASGRVHCASISAVPLTEAQRQNHQVKVLVVQQSWSPDHSRKADSYAGLIVALKSRAELATLQDLKGRAFGFVARDSSSGFVFPNAALQAAGIEYATFFSPYVFLGSHQRVADALVAGSIDAGATADFNLGEARKKHGDIFKILSEVRIPNLAIATHPSLGEARRKVLKQALLAAGPALFEGLPTAGFVERPESFYDGVRRLLPAEPE